MPDERRIELKEQRWFYHPRGYSQPLDFISADRMDAGQRIVAVIVAEHECRIEVMYENSELWGLCESLRHDGSGPHHFYPNDCAAWLSIKVPVRRCMVPGCTKESRDA
jgi:hypothetical protein